VLFVPASVDQLVLLGPQLDFYHAGSLVMGLSNWNSAKLAERSGTVLDRAIFPDDFPLFPARWSVEFEASWRSENYPPEATELALKAYQATRMLLDTMGQSGAVTRDQLADALRRRLSNQDFEAEGPDSFGPTVRMFVDKRIVPFPSDLYRDGWMLAEAAAAYDSLAAQAAGDSLGISGFQE
jgi:ABC-type branched-subunit amino acid transport system substrate-binding protein